MTRHLIGDTIEGRLSAADGSYHGSIRPAAWALPFAVRVEQGYLLFDWEGATRGRGFKSDVGDRITLVEFLKLGMADDHRIAEFARRHGALGLCGHGRSKYHPPYGVSGPRQVEVCIEPSAGTEWDAELIESWRDYADEMSDLLEMAARPRSELGILDQADVESVRHWIRDGSIQPGLDWRDDRFVVVLGNGTLLGALVVQLMYLIAGGGPGLALCDGCQSWYSPRRAPPTGRRSFCGSCKGDRRLASSDYRQRNRDDPDRVRLDRGRRIASQATSEPQAIHNPRDARSKRVGR